VLGPKLDYHKSSRPVASSRLACSLVCTIVASLALDPRSCQPPSKSSIPSRPLAPPLGDRCAKRAARQPISAPRSVAAALEPREPYPPKLLCCYCCWPCSPLLAIGLEPPCPASLADWRFPSSHTYFLATTTSPPRAHDGAHVACARRTHVHASPRTAALPKHARPPSRVGCPFMIPPPKPRTHGPRKWAWRGRHAGGAVRGREAPHHRELLQQERFRWLAYVLHSSDVALLLSGRRRRSTARTSSRRGGGKPTRHHRLTQCSARDLHHAYPNHRVLVPSHDAATPASSDARF